jgi:hypothetical protein
MKFMNLTRIRYSVLKNMRHNYVPGIACSENILRNHSLYHPSLQPLFKNVLQICGPDITVTLLLTQGGCVRDGVMN